MCMQQFDSDYRFVIEYQVLCNIYASKGASSKFRRDAIAAYLLPKQDEILSALEGSVIFSSMDILKGFFQQRIWKEDRWKTAFVMIYRGYEQLTVLIMGLANSPGCFQHRIEMIFSSYLWQ